MISEHGPVKYVQESPFLYDEYTMRNGQDSLYSLYHNKIIRISFTSKGMPINYAKCYGGGWKDKAAGENCIKNGAEALKIAYFWSRKKIC